MMYGGFTNYISLMDNTALMLTALELLEAKERNEEEINKFKQELEAKIEANRKAMNDFDRWVDNKSEEAKGEDYESL